MHHLLCCVQGASGWVRWGASGGCGGGVVGGCGGGQVGGCGGGLVGVCGLIILVMARVCGEMIVPPDE